MKNKFFWLIAFLLWFLLAIFSLHPIISGIFPFWYDPARDMLSAWNNLHKITLIGSTSGIPGIFYGPYWIWFLSISIFFSKDPRLATFVVSFIPYIFFFPIVLYQFKKYFDKDILLVLWVFFIIGFKSYVIFIWNPNNSPLLFLLAVYMILSAVNQEGFPSNLKKLFLSGIVAGLALSINMSFGAVFALSSVLFFLLNAIFFLRKTFKTRIRSFFSQLISFLIGIALTFTPFLVFEIRHGFEQIKTAVAALTHGGGGFVTVHGLTKQQIVESFFSRWGQLLHIPFNLSLVILVVLAIIFIILLVQRRICFSKQEKIMFLFIFSLILSCLGLYLLVRNPVWDYHFIGVEIFWILLLGIFLTKIPFVRFIAYGLILILVIMQSIIFFGTLHTPILATDSLAAKEYIVKMIANDANSKAYNVYAYNPSIYTYEYSYLFRWLVGKDIPYDPASVKRQGDIYLILPQEKKSILEDFINYRTPSKLYKTVKTWSVPNGTFILKRSLM